jgi:hypothetical protein
MMSDPLTSALLGGGQGGRGEWGGPGKRGLGSTSAQLHIICSDLKGGLVESLKQIELKGGQHQLDSQRVLLRSRG